MYRINIHTGLDSLSKAKESLFIPSEVKIRRWVKAALRHKVRRGEVTVCLATKKTIRTLNKNYRHKDKPTNVLSFRAELPKQLKLKIPLLGDIIVCAAVVNEEAKKQRKLPEAHWAHIIMHGVLHILGYDHETPAEAEAMEAKEIKLLKNLGFDNPY
jgi:probable rRNA maturation factor